MFTRSTNRHRHWSRRGIRPEIRRPMAERLEDRCLLATVSFSYVDRFGSDIFWDVIAGDFNADGVVDLAGVDGSTHLSLLFGNGEGTFQRPARYRVGSTPFALESADLVGDTDLDLVVANNRSQDVSVLLNDGKGNFGDQSTYFVPFGTSRDVVIADFNGDSHVDLAISSTDGLVGVLAGRGDGTFADTVTYDAPNTGSVLAGDINGDGHFDLVVGPGGYLLSGKGQLAGALSLLLNSGDGTFEAPDIYEPENLVNAAAAVGLGDLDSDGKLELVAAWGANSGCDVTVLSGNGDGTITPTGAFNTRHHVWILMLIRDFNSDGHLDLLIDNRSNTMSVVVGNGDGTFSDAVSVFVPVASGQLAVADFNGDGLLDIATTTNTGIAVFLNTTGTTPQTGVFNSDGEQPLDRDVGLFTMGAQCLGGRETESLDVTFGDLDRDSDLDAFVANNGRNEVWINDGRGLFEETDQRPGSGNTQHVALGDVDGDGDLDAFLANSNRRPNEVWLNDGAGVFENSRQRLGRSSTYDVVLGDADGDGDLDAFAANAERQANKLWLNDGNGVFADSGQQLGQSTTRSVAVGDVDGDGDLDAVDVVDVWLNDGNGQFSGSDHRLGRSSATSVELGDLDGDGDLDVFVGSRRSTVWLNDGHGVFQDSGQQLGRATATDMELADIDGDGDLDAFVTHARRQANDVWLNDGNAIFQHIGRQFDASSSEGVGLGDVDGDGDIDALVVNNDRQPNSLWINNTNSPAPIRQAGDANEDFRFDQLDIVEVLQAAKYLTGAPADWSEGDWDGNGVFDQLDIVLALATGNYLQGPYAASSRASIVDELLAGEDLSTPALDEE